MVLSDLYESRYGIYNHLAGNAKRKPFASVAMHPKEDYLGQSRLRMHYLRYLSEEVYQLTGESWEDYINQPAYIMEIKLEALAEYKRMLKEQKKKFEEEMRQNGGKPP